MSGAGDQAGSPAAGDQALWDSVDAYLSATLVPADPALDTALQAALEASTAAGLPAIQVAPNQGKLLHLLARITGARRILEIGTLGGYSTIWLASALPADGRLISLEAEARHAAVARTSIERAGLGAMVEVAVGPALETLPTLAEHPDGGFDLFFVDADKASIPEYITLSLRLSHPGSVNNVDNVVRRGGVADASSTDPDVMGVRRGLEMIAAEPRLAATAIQTVGSKGHDGFAIALVTG